MLLNFLKRYNVYAHSSRKMKCAVFRITSLFIDIRPYEPQANRFKAVLYSKHNAAFILQAKKPQNAANCAQISHNSLDNNTLV